MEKTHYKISKQLYADSRFVTYRAEEDNGLEILLKLPKSSYPSVQVIKKLEREYAILIKAQHPNITRVQGMEPYENSLALILEDTKGPSLNELIKNNPLNLGSFFTLAISLSDAVNLLHSQRIIHKNINPSNIIIDSLTGQLKLIGFGLATEISREPQDANAREVQDAELSYISPEQTGRMNRRIDLRTDLYSLGIVFFEMLCGQPPFICGDPMEMIHSHIARQPRLIHELKHDVPEVISMIINKLLSKSADDRYQSISGLLYDLKRCYDQFINKGSVDFFELGERDIHDQFRIPDKLYGRTAELEQLIDSFKTAAEGQTKLVLISGYSGVGKSQLVSEVKKMIGQGKGYFISGKFDQFKRDIPLSSLFTAFKELILQLLTENDEQIAAWKNKLLNALGYNGKIITDILPEIEMLIGVQNAVPQLPPAESNNRFNEVINRFVNCFARAEHPLCIFLDDLQWIDSATRQWIETQISQEGNGYFMLIGAYRDNEITVSHPLMLMLERLRETNVSLSEIHLKPLDRNTLNQMIADVLVTPKEKCCDLSDLIYQKTNGNPFFSRQCLLTLSETNAIYFDNEIHEWKYKLDLARNAEICDNVLDLMSGQIRRLPASTQKILKIASCIGNHFSIQLLADVSENDLENTNTTIAATAEKGLVLPVYSWDKDDIDEYKFLHDRVQQAAYSLLNDSEKQSIRLKAGRILLQQATVYEKEEKVYEIADHLNYAKNLLVDEEEIKQFIAINLAASVRAKNATAYEPALRYITHAMDRVPTWKQHSTLTSSLLLQRAECEHLSGNNTAAEDYYNKAIDHADGILEKAKVYEQKIHYYTNLRKFKDAYQAGRDAVKPLGVYLPPTFIPPLLIKDLIAYRFRLGNKHIKELIDIKEMTDENLKMAIQLMATFGRAAYQIKPELCVAVCTKMVNICLKHGNTDGGFIGYLALGPIFIGAIMNRKQSGYEYGQLILALVEKYKSRYYRAETHFVVGYFAVPWRRPAIEMERYWQIAYEAGLEVGDLFHASCACSGTVQSLYMRGINFDEIISTSDRYLEFLNHINNNEGILTIQSVRQAIKNLRAETESAPSWNSEDFDEAEYISALSGFQSRHFAHYYFINKMQTLYLHGEYEKAYDVSLISDSYLKDSPGMLHTAEHYFYKALIICAVYPTGTTFQKTKWKKALYKIRGLFRSYGKGCEKNFIHKQQLIEAEISRINGDQSATQNYYYAAIDSAARCGYTNIHALGNAMAAKFHFDAGRRRMAGFHLQDAVYSFTTIGAAAYAEKLQARYPGISIQDEHALAGKSSDSNGLIAAAKHSNIDLATILKSSEAISREIRLHDLLSSLLKIIIENAGAERMLLLLQQNNQLVVQAECITGSEEVAILPEIPLDQYQDISKSIVNYVAHAQQPVILDDATMQGNFTNDIYFIENRTRSVLCAPLVQQGKLTGVIYLENNLTNAAFTQERIDLLILLSGQMAISIENSLLYENLEMKVKERTRELNEEKNKSELLLLNILPAETADELKRTGAAKAKEFEQVTVLFTDFKNFTAVSEQMNAQELVSEINFCYSTFDNIISKYGIEKIKTIGDSYMCAGGLPVESTTNPFDTLRAALEIRDFMIEERQKRALTGKSFFEIRIGLHTGPVVAGIVGIKKFAYDIWGDTVNIASRMESSGAPGMVNISGNTYELVKDQFNCSFRGKLEAKNKGMVDMYFVETLK